MISVECDNERLEAFFALSDVPEILYQALLQSFEFPFVILDRNYRFRWVDEDHSEGFHKYIGQVCYESVANRDCPCPDCPVTILFEKGKLATTKKLVHFPNGSNVFCAIQAYPVFDKSHNMVYAITTARGFGDKGIDLAKQHRRIEMLERALHDLMEPNSQPFFRSSTAQAAIGLSGRELQVLKLMAEGLPNSAISDVLSLSPYTVKTYVSRIFNKLGVSDRTQAATIATRLKLI